MSYRKISCVKKSLIKKIRIGKNVIKLNFFKLTFKLFHLFQNHKKIVFLLKKVTKIVQQRDVDFALAPRPCFFQGRELANTGYGTLIHFKNINYFTLFCNTFR